MDATYKEQALAARLKVLQMIHHAQTSHIASNFSVIDIATVLYANLKEGDEVVWSKGWVSASIYYFLAKQGKIPVEDLDKFQDKEYLGLAETNVPGVLVNGGSVGHGLSVAVGIALGKKRASVPGTVYCIMSDGELNEGAVWEAAMVAAHHKLDNLVALIDNNGWQAMGRTEEICDIDIERAFGGFGWGAMLADGHNYQDIESSIGWALIKRSRPSVIICDTIKGKGVACFEDKILYHYKNIDDETYERAKAELV